VTSPNACAASSSHIYESQAEIQVPEIPTGMAGLSGVPVRSKEDCLHEEIQYLRQRLADANEEKQIEVAIVRDDVALARSEVADKQQQIIDLIRKNAETESSLRSAKDEIGSLKTNQRTGMLSAIDVTNSFGERGMLLDQRAADLEARGRMLERRKTELDRREEEMRWAQQEREKELKDQCEDLESQCRNLHDLCGNLRSSTRDHERSAEALRAQLAQRESELRIAQLRLARLEVPSDVLLTASTAAEVVQWEEEVRDCFNTSLARLAGRHVELRVSEAMAQEQALCKICFDRPSSCALLPCKHHAFCVPCGERIRRGRDPVCPLCRTGVVGLFETFTA